MDNVLEITPAGETLLNKLFSDEGPATIKDDLTVQGPQIDCKTLKPIEAT